ncbi:MAG TPA: ABC transporter permease [Pyrinomonadaceae bacterium]
MRTFLQDLRYGLRVLRKSPGFTAVAVLTLGLGIGVNTAIFSGVSAFMLRPLAGVSDAERLVALFEATDGSAYDDVSYPDYLDYREQSTTLDGIVGHQMVRAAVGDETQSEVVWGQLVSADLFDVLGVRMRMGRGFLPEEERTPGTHPVIVLGPHLWRNRFAADAGIVGRTVSVNGRPFTVVGVAPDDFAGAKWALRMDFFVPLGMQEQVMGGQSWLNDRDSHWLSLMGRLKPGATREQAAAELSTIARRLNEAYPNERTKGARVNVVTEQDSRFQDMAGVARMGGGLALAIVGLVLLIACANVANLLLARSVSRRREIAVRLALGAGRARIVRQLLTESLLLAAAGGLTGLLLSFWLTDMMTGFFPALPYAMSFSVAPDARALIFTLAVSLLTGLAFGLAPALQASRPNLIPVLKGETPQARGRGRRFSMRNLLVVSQMALSLVVLVCAGLFVKSFNNAKTVDIGFTSEGVMTASLNPGLFGYTREQGREFYRQLIERVEALPGVEGAGAAYLLPLGDSSTSWGPVYAAEQPVPPPGEGRGVQINIVSPGYFDTLQIPLLRGRDFNAHDLPGAKPEAVVINETFAARYWPGEDPLGKRVKVGRDDPETLEVVGVVKDGKYRTLGEPPRPFMFVSLDQTYQSGMTLVVRAQGDPARYVEALREATKSVDARVPLYNVKTMREHLTWALWAPNMAASLAAAFGILALLLAATGLYSVLAYAVSQRTHEIGIRMALGAQRGDILRLITRQGMALALVGLVLGLGAAAGSARVIASLLFGVSPTDAYVFAAISLALALVALLACYIPARRATKVDPMVALRYE